MKKLILLSISLLLISSHCWSADRGRIEVRASSNDEQTTLMDTGLLLSTFPSSVRQTSKISIDASSTKSITVPNGAKAVLIDVGGYEGLHLSGASGDKGISLDNTVPVLLSLSADGNTTIVISNDIGSSATITAWWF